ncbi:complement resistance protein TraT [Shewanella olleyana]|uniref:complement resistance protein TraT n=1 Tax=Shewanella olleyana TaxID=135626 RepID=UPI00200DDDFE|nr:complement resistance protein TraT [Shewanella olleyana]MCL1065852.1 complement resistance protein TraT [Shewanella olleyana]
MISSEHFSFTISELELLFRVQYFALETEINAGQSSSALRNIFRTKDSTESFEKENIINKKLWLEEWANATCSLLNIQLRDSFLKDDIQKCFGLWSDAKVSAFLVEVATFTPYVSLGNKSKDKSYSSIKYNEEKLQIALAENLSCKSADIAGINKTYTKTIKAIYKETTSNNTLLILSAAAAVSLLMAPYLAAGIGGLMGLSGAAATSAGLAFLGGGSLATTGFGMAGGYVATMGGGMLLSFGANQANISKQFSSISTNEIVVSSAKLAAFLSHYKFLVSIPARKELFIDTCASLRNLQSVFETVADSAYIAADKEGGKNAEDKVQKLAAFRRIIRTDVQKD